MELDPKVLYWTGAWVNMAFIVMLIRSGIGQLRIGRVDLHRNRVLLASLLVLGFLVSYVFKLMWLGREDLASWDPVYVYLLRFHEVCVLLMTVSGGLALTIATRLRLNQASDGSESGLTKDTFRQRIQQHRRAGGITYLSAILGLLTAAVVLFGMYQRTLSP